MSLSMMIVELMHAPIMMVTSMVAIHVCVLRQFLVDVRHTYLVFGQCFTCYNVNAFVVQFNYCFWCLWERDDVREALFNVFLNIFWFHFYLQF